MAEQDNRPQEPQAQPAAPQQAGQQSPQRENRGAQAQQAVQQGRPCPKDCSKCSMGHQIYCTAKMTFDSFAVMGTIIQRLDIQSQRITQMEKQLQDAERRLEDMQSQEAEFSSPMPVDGDIFA